MIGETRAEKTWALWSAFAAVLNFCLGALADNWVSYAVAVLCAAWFFFQVRQIQQREAVPAVATFDPSDQIRKQMQQILSSGSSGYTYQSTTTSSAPAKTAGEFAGVPFDLAIGEVYGLRMWRMDEYGRLRARNWTTAPAWRPGVNIAKCVERPADGYISAMSRAIYGSSSLSSSVSRPSPRPPHLVPSESCQCGFYAYTDSRHAETLQYKNANVVLGIVKGTGRTLMGTKGFRCEKAEIVALRDPTRGGTKNDAWRVQQLANLRRIYPDIPILESRVALLEFAPLTNTLPEPGTDEFWALP